MLRCIIIELLKTRDKKKIVKMTKEKKIHYVHRIRRADFKIGNSANEKTMEQRL